MSANLGDGPSRHALAPFMLLGRVPYQGPRRRELAPGVTARFRRWLAAELHLSPQATIEVVEWVAFDSRETPHTTLIVLGDGQRQFAFTVGKALQHIGTLDLPRPARTWRASAEPGSARQPVR